MTSPDNESQDANSTEDVNPNQQSVETTMQDWGSGSLHTSNAPEPENKRIYRK